MTRNDIARVLEGIELTDVQVKALLDLNSADIGKALNKQGAELTDAQTRLQAAGDTIATLEKAAGDAKALQAELDKYKQAEADRAAREKAQAERDALTKRVDAALNGREFLHNRLKDVYIQDFKAALEDAANVGKSDKEVLDAITRDAECFKPINPILPPTQPPTGDIDEAMTKEKFRALPMAKQFAFANAYPEEARRYL